MSQYPGYEPLHPGREAPKPMGKDEYMQMVRDIQEHTQQRYGSVTMEQAVARVSALRDGGDLPDEN